MRWALVITVALGLAPADARGDDVAAAEALFQEARKLMDAGKWTEACPKLEESLRLDPGMGTRWHLARCYENTERLASAWAKYHEVAQEAKRASQPRRAKAAARAARQLEPRLVKLVIEVPRESRVDGLTVVRDGHEVGPGAWGARVPVDAGQLTIQASAPDREPWSKVVDVKPGDTLITVEVPRLDLTSKPDGPDPKPGGDPVVAPPPVPSDRTPWYHDRVGWVITGAGVALAGAGIGSLLHSSSLEDQSQMPGPIDEREDQANRAETYQTLGAVLSIAGAGALVAGVVKLALRPKPRESGAVSIQPSIGWGMRSILVGVGATF